MTKPYLQRKISSILNNENINKPENSGAKQGLEKALEILKSNQRYLTGIIELETTQARAIAKFAVDFNNLKHDGSFFIKFGDVIKSNNKNKL